MARKASKTPRVTENDDFVAMVQRMISALEKRAVDDPALLFQVLMLAERLSEVTNVVIAQSAASYKRDPKSAPSASEIGRWLGMTRQSASERRKVGDRILFDRMVGETASRRDRAARTRAQTYADRLIGEWMAANDITSR